MSKIVVKCLLQEFFFFVERVIVHTYFSGVFLFWQSLSEYAMDAFKTLLDI